MTKRSIFDAPKAEDALIAIFGASGDLTARKLIPALFRLWTEGFLSGRAPIVGVARREKTDDPFRQEMAEAVKEEAPPVRGRTRSGQSSPSGSFITGRTSKIPTSSPA